MDLIAILEKGRKDFLDAAREISVDHARARPGPKAWSVLECIEHVATVEDRYLAWILNGPAIEPRRDHEKEFRLFTGMRSRLRKAEAPEFVHPRGRFSTMEAALAAFEEVRDRSVATVRERGEALYGVGAKHPFFGEMNGAEVVHLMDGHARRHADQIRETWEAVAAVKEQIREKKKGPKRAAPDLPKELEAREFSEDRVEDALLQDLERRGLRLGSLRIEGSVLERVQLAEGQFGSLTMKDVRLVGCDLANLRVRRLSLVRVEMIDCRLTGLIASGIEAQDLLLQNCDAKYAQLSGGQFRACEIDGCNLSEADLQNSDLAGAEIRGSNLNRADFRGAKLKGTDFRGSDVDGMVVGADDLRGAIADVGQAMVFARVMGLEIR